MTESSGNRAFLVDLVRRAHAGDAWHGPAFGELVAGLDAQEAAAHPVPGAHSIWEIALHVTSWRNEVARRLATGALAEPAAGDWPPAPAATDAAWAGALTALAAATEALGAALERLPEARLDERAGEARDPALGSGVTWRAMVHGIIQHDAYHGGQVAILKKALAVREDA